MPTTKMTGAPKIHSAATRSRPPPSSVDDVELTAATTSGDDDDDNDDDVVDVDSVVLYDFIILLQFSALITSTMALYTNFITVVITISAVVGSTNTYVYSSQQLESANIPSRIPTTTASVPRLLF